MRENAWKLFLNYDGLGSRVAGAAVSASSGDTPAVGAYAFLEDGVGPRSTLRVLLTAKAPKGGASQTAALSVAWPSGTRSGTVVAQVYGLSAGQPALSPLGNVTLACGEGSQPTPVALEAWSATLLVLPYACG